MLPPDRGRLRKVAVVPPDRRRHSGTLSRASLPVILRRTPGVEGDSLASPHRLHQPGQPGQPGVGGGSLGLLE
jgi:hypothetical protein